MNRRKITASLLVIVTVAFLGAGCGGKSRDLQKPKPAGPAASSTDAERGPSPLKLVEAGFTVVEGPYIEYGFILKNPNANFGAEFPTVRITMRDASGNVIGTGEQVLNRIMPLETVAWGGQANPNGKEPATVEFEALSPGDNWKPVDQMKPVGFKPFEVVGLNANKSDFSVSFTGELTNPNSVDFEQVAVSILLRDDSDKIVAGYTGYAEKLSAKGKVPFEVDSLGQIPEYAKFEAYAQPW